MPDKTNVESALLACIVNNPLAYIERCDRITPEIFSDDRNKAIVRAISQFTNGKYDRILIAQKLIESGTYGLVGDAYMNELASTTASEALVDEYLEQVLASSLHARIIRLSEKAIMDAKDHKNHDEIIHNLVNGLYVSDNTRKLTSSADIFTELINRLKTKENPDLRLTGINAIDRWMGGIELGELMVVGARPGSGKTSLMLQLARGFALTGAKVAIFSLEMPTNQLAVRIASHEVGIPIGDIRTTAVAQNHILMDRLGTASMAKWLGDVFVFDNMFDATQIENTIRRLRKTENVEVFIIDYLQLMEGKGQTRNDVVERICRGLKKTLMQTHSIGIVGSQLNRSMTDRSLSAGEAKPKVSDLRASGAIEQDADIVALIHNPDNDLQEIRDAEINWAKGRNIGKNYTSLSYQSNIAKFLFDEVAPF